MSFKAPPTGETGTAARREALKTPYAHYSLPLIRKGGTVRVEIDDDANVLLLDDAAFMAYRERRPFNYVGGAYAPGTHLIGVPRDANWHVVIDLGGRAGTLTHSVGTLSAH